MPTLRNRVAAALIGLLGCAFILLGFSLALRAQGNGIEVPYIRLFGIRDAFLGGYTLLLMMRGETRALSLFLAAAMLLPVADSVALAGLIGWARAAASNLPFELPLALALALVPRLQAART
jgi:hypothetical protein